MYASFLSEQASATTLQYAKRTSNGSASFQARGLQQEKFSVLTKTNSERTRIDQKTTRIRGATSVP